MTRTAASLMIVALLAGCSTLPRDGPSGRNVVEGAASPERAGDYAQAAWLSALLGGFSLVLFVAVRLLQNKELAKHDVLHPG